jgi:hypothetical protein
MKKLNHLKLYENFGEERIIFIKADTSAVVIDGLSDIEVGELCINKAKKVSDLITGNVLVMVLLMGGMSNGYNMFHYNNGVITDTEPDEYDKILARHNIKSGKDLEKLPTIEVDLYGGK